MVNVGEVFRVVVNSIARSKVSLIGALISTVIFPFLFVAAALDMQGIIKNPYFGFLTYMVMGPLFGLGLLLLLLGIIFFKGTEDIGIYTYEYLKEQFTKPGRVSRVRRLIILITLIINITIIVVLVFSYSAFHYTESVAFCGQFCHRVMNPEYVTFQNSPHSRVSCVECHIGEDAEWFTRSKFSGVKQLFAVAFDTYSKPIKTPIGGLRPRRQTCEECHRPEMFHGAKLYVKDKFLPDEENTHLQTAMLIKVGSGGYRGQEAHGIHWHVSPENKIVYRYTDRERQNIVEVKLIKADGTEVVYAKTESEAGNSRDSGNPDSQQGGESEMDCMDCHNRPTHIYLSPDEALDLKLFTGEIPRELPFIKREALAAITKKYATAEKARNGINIQLLGWYREHYPEITEKQSSLLAKAVRGVQMAYVENVFPEMNVEWGTYKDFIGHDDNGGCFRCHDGSHRSESGEFISTTCESCHTILAKEQPASEVLNICAMEE